MICGTLVPSPPGSGKRVSNAAVLMQNGEITFTQRKMLLPFYDVFDEQRYFAPASQPGSGEDRQRLVAVTICEDAWNDKNFWPQRLYTIDPIEELMAQGPQTLYQHLGIALLAGQARDAARGCCRRLHGATASPCCRLMLNQVGGNDSLIFDGSSLAINAKGEVVAEATSFAEDLVIVDPATGSCDLQPPDEDDSEGAYRALVLGTRDYVRKCGFKKALIGSERRDRFGAGGGDCRGGAGRGERDRRGHAESVLVARVD